MADVLGQAIKAWIEEEERRAEVQRVRDTFAGMTRDEVRALWDRYDGINAPDGFAGEDIHFYLNLIGDGAYCPV